MSESGDYDPGPWRGHDFGTAYKRYDTHAGRSYAAAVEADTDLSAVLEKNLVSKARAVLVVANDVTGSMDEWPKVMFSKLPYLELEAQEYLGKDLEIAWMATGDASKNDRYPLQARPFTKGTDLKKRLEELIIEKGGGGGGQESYEATAYYAARHIEMPNAVRAIFIQIGDESPYPFVVKDQVKRMLGDEYDGRLSVAEIYEELKRKFSVYIIRKPYQTSSGDAMSDFDRNCHAQWAALLGEDHVAYLPDPARVVDVIFGILAKETGRIEYFKEEIEGRQKPGQVATAYKALNTIHAAAATKSKKLLGHSTLAKTGKTKKVDDLM